MTRILLTGATGFIGRPLVESLHASGHQVTVITRDADRARQTFAALDPDGNRERDARAGSLELIQADPAYAGAWQEALGRIDAIINMAGENIGGERWTAQYKQRLRDSRVETTRVLVEGVAQLEPEQRPGVLINASGADYYPFAVDLGAAMAVDEDDEVAEGTPPGSSFLARLCQSWESEARAAEELGLRVVRMRTGVVLGQGGALERMETPFRFFVGGRIGNGRQWFSWIHRRDAVRGYVFALAHDEVSGPVNLVAPQPVRQRQLADELGRAMGRPSWLPVPGFALRAAVGEFAEYLLHGRRTVPRALLDAGFEFRYPDLRSALDQVY